jgi:muramoyltetrapeptide carboxypeptidase LdcA involved in peptidoglycan recycling
VSIASLAPLVPPRVRAGDTVAVVSPSAPAVGQYPRRVERARRYLGSIGLEMRLMPHAAGVDGWVSASAQARADDIHRAFSDEDVSLVLAGIGGNHSNAVVAHLDFELIRTHAKAFCGYSDVSVLHWAMLRGAGLRTFYGPSLVAELGEHPAPLPFTDAWFRRALMGDAPLELEAAGEWTDEFLDWDAGADVRPRALRPAAGWRTVRSGRARGWLLAGCLETVCWHVKGSAAWVDPEGAILVLETSEEAPSPADVDSLLTDLEALGVFARAAGLVVGRPYGYDEEACDALCEVVERRTREAAIPVLAMVDCGHTDPMLTLPIGAPAEIDAGAHVLRTTEAATRP